MEEKRIDDPEFWDELSTSFKATSLLLHDQAEELGIDLDHLEDEEMEIDEEEPILDFLAVLDEIRKKVRELFPKALEFDYFEHFDFIR